MVPDKNRLFSWGSVGGPVPKTAKNEVYRYDQLLHRNFYARE